MRLRPGGLILVDNVLGAGRVLDRDGLDRESAGPSPRSAS